MPMTPKQLRSALKRLGLSQVAAASKMGVDPRTMRNWVAGKHRIPETAVLLLRTWLRESK